MARVLYITQDGITDHIGQAQIAPYLVGLARLGHSIHIVSAEKPGRADARARYRRLFADVGIRWTSVRYANHPPLVSSFLTLALMERAARRVFKAERPQVVHCRSYLPLGIAARLRRSFGGKYLADFRDFWADVGIETKRFKPVFRWFRKREPHVLAPADHVVTLTDKAARLLIGRHPHVVGGDRDRYSVIPCCADFGLFDPDRIADQALAERRAALGIAPDATVMIYLGSLGPDYLLPEMLKLFRALRALRSDAVFLFLTNNGHELAEREARATGVPVESLRFAAADRQEVPEYIALADLSVVFIRPTESKAGCSPTKLGELFAMNVPIIANSGFGDIDRIVAPEVNGSVVIADFAPDTLDHALRTVLSGKAKNGTAIREASREFSLEEGVRLYDHIYNRLTGDNDADGSGRIADETCSTSSY